MKLSAIDSLQHGLLNLRANWQLAVVLFVQTLVVSVISLLGFVPVALVLGFTFLRGVLSDFDTDGGAALLGRIAESIGPLILAFLAATLIWTIAFVVYCYVQGGVLGTLAAGERKAVTESIRWQNYRVFSLQAFFRHAEGLTWPIFWLLNLFMLIGLVFITVFGIGAVAISALLSQGPTAAQFAVGCLALLIFVVAMMLLMVWLQLALAELATGTRSALAATGAALKVAFKRLPGVALLVLILFVLSIVLAIIFLPVSMVLEVALRQRMGAYFAGQAMITLVQWLASGFVTVGWSATLIALVLGERELAA